MSISCYLFLSYKYLQGYKETHNNNLNGHAVNYQWLRQIVSVFLVFQAIWFLFLIPYVIPRYYDALMNSVDWYPIYIPLACIIYWLGIKGYIISQKDELPVKKSTSISDILPSSIIDETSSALVTAMEKDKLYLNPNLNVSLVAQHIGTTPKIISAVLNQHLHKSFNEFVNEYRILTFKEKVKQRDMDHLTIAGIAFECGFNSQATFQRTFKQMTGLSPSEFRNDALEIE